MARAAARPCWYALFQCSTPTRLKIGGAWLATSPAAYTSGSEGPTVLVDEHPAVDRRAGGGQEPLLRVMPIPATTRSQASRRPFVVTSERSPRIAPPSGIPAVHAPRRARSPADGRFRLSVPVACAERRVG